jgi:hypothetical protein
MLLTREAAANPETKHQRRCGRAGRNVREARRIEVQRGLHADGDLGSKRRFAMGALEGGIPLARSFITESKKFTAAGRP